MQEMYFTVRSIIQIEPYSISLGTITWENQCVAYVILFTTSNLLRDFVAFNNVVLLVFCCKRIKIMRPICLSRDRLQALFSPAHRQISTFFSSTCLDRSELIEVELASIFHQSRDYLNPSIANRNQAIFHM